MKDEVLYEFIPELINEEVPEQGRSLGAVELLKKDHRQVQDLLKRALKVQAKQEQYRLAVQICTMLKVHSQLEEELVYPLLQEEDSDEAVESYLEHALVKFVIKQIESLSAKDKGLAPRIKVLNELVKHHVKEEETIALPELERAKKVDLRELGLKIAERKQQLEQRMNSKHDSQRSNGKKASGKKVTSGQKSATASNKKSASSGRSKKASDSKAARRKASSNKMSTKSKPSSRSKGAKARKAA